MGKKAKLRYLKKNPICADLVTGFGNIPKTTHLLIMLLTSQKWAVISILAEIVNDDLLAHLYPNGILKNDKGSRHKTIPSVM